LESRRRHKGGRAIKRSKEEFALNTDDEETNNDSLGAWVLCDICVSASHFKCLNPAVKLPLVATLQSQHIALHTSGIVPPPVTDEMKIGGEKEPDNEDKGPPRDKIELDPQAVLHVKKCAHCIRAAKCYKCDNIKRVDDDALLFRCSSCQRSIHFECLPREDYVESTKEAHAQEWIDAKLCQQCLDWFRDIDFILAWRRSKKLDLDGDTSMTEISAMDDVTALERRRRDKGKSKEGDESKVNDVGGVESEEFNLPTVKDATAPVEYLIKWKELSYRHLSWIPHSFLARAATMKLSNFLAVGSRINFEAPIENDIDLSDDREDEPTPESTAEVIHSAPKEDPNAEERISAAWSTIDRVLDVFYRGKNNGDRIKYEDYYRNLPSDPAESMKLVVEGYFKWGDLPYADSTIEAPPKPDEAGYASWVEAYKNFLVARSPGMLVPSLSAKQLATLQIAPPEKNFVPLAEQPKHIVGGRMMDYQLAGVNFMYFNWWRRKGCILADEMGLGKTLQIITLLSVLSVDNAARPFMVIVPLSTISNWMREFKRWAPGLRVVPYTGCGQSRKIISKYELFDKSGKLKTRPFCPLFFFHATKY
jgi:hypothetical protein